MENKFILNSTVENKSNNDSDDLILTGIASTANERSLYGELMTEDALNQMCEQAVGLPILEGHDGKSLDNVIGVIINAYVEDNDLHIDFKVTPNHRERIQEFLDTGIPIGLSIGAQGAIDTDSQKVMEITLVEVSLTPIPANRAAHNTVEVKEDYYIGDCLSGICYQMIKDTMEETNMAEEEKITQAVGEVKEEEPLTIEKVKNMLDERFAEEKEALVATIVDEVKTELKKVEESFEVEEIEDAVKPEEEEEEPKEGASEDGASEEEGDAKEEEEEKEEKEVKESITIDEDKIVNDITERILESLGEKRDVSGTKTEEALKESAEPEEEHKPFTSEEAAKFIINDINRRDPLARAINEARNL